MHFAALLKKVCKIVGFWSIRQILRSNLSLSESDRLRWCSGFVRGGFAARSPPNTVNFNLDSSLSGSDREGSEVEIQPPLPVATSPFGLRVPSTMSTRRPPLSLACPSPLHPTTLLLYKFKRLNGVSPESYDFIYVFPSKLVRASPEGSPEESGRVRKVTILYVFFHQSWYGRDSGCVGQAAGGCFTTSAAVERDTCRVRGSTS